MLIRFKIGFRLSLALISSFNATLFNSFVARIQEIFDKLSQLRNVVVFLSVEWLLSHCSRKAFQRSGIGGLGQQSVLGPVANPFTP